MCARDKARDNTGNSFDGAVLAAAAQEGVSRFGSGIKEFLVAYSGVDNETGFKWQQSLKSISERKISADQTTDPKGYYQQLKAHSGFSAEIREVSRRRAEEAISGKVPKTLRTDDVPRTDGGTNVNHPLFDVTSKVDAYGNPDPACSAQIKFRGCDPEGCLKILSGSQCKKYVDNNCKLMVPSDYYDGIKESLAKKIEKLRDQIAKLEKSGNQEALLKRRAELNKYRTIDRNLEQSKVSVADSEEGYLNPKIATAKDVLSTAHGAGWAQMKTGAAVGGGVSLARNLVSVYKGEKTIQDAVVDVAGDTASAAAASYGIAFTGALIKGFSQNATSTYIRVLSKTNLPAYIASSAIEIGKILARYARGKIDGAQCVEQLGTQGYCMTTSAMYSVIGQAVIPIPIVGAMAGSMFGYFVGSASYKILKDSLAEAKLARTERIRIEKECEESIRMMQENRKALHKMIDDYLKNEEAFFNTVFSSVKECLAIGDVDGYVEGTNRIIRHLGKDPLYENCVEFDNLMKNRDELMVI